MIEPINVSITEVAGVGTCSENAVDNRSHHDRDGHYGSDVGDGSGVEEGSTRRMQQNQNTDDGTGNLRNHIFALHETASQTLAALSTDCRNYQSLR